MFLICNHITTRVDETVLIVVHTWKRDSDSMTIDLSGGNLAENSQLVRVRNFLLPLFFLCAAERAAKI